VKKRCPVFPKNSRKNSNADPITQESDHDTGDPRLHSHLRQADQDPGARAQSERCHRAQMARARECSRCLAPIAPDADPPLSRSQELLVIELRRTLLLSLDDLTAITRAHIYPQASRAAIGRLLKREGLSRLADLMPVEEGEAAPRKTFKDYLCPLGYAPGYFHIDLKTLPPMPDESRESYLCVAIDRASRWVYFEILPDKTAKGTQGFVERLAKACPQQGHIWSAPYCKKKFACDIKK